MEVTSKRRITVDIRKNNKVAIPSFVQGDTNVVEFEILDNGVAADLSTVGKVVANYKRPDKHVVTREATYAGNIVSYRMGQEEMEVAGLGEVEVRFFNADYSKRVSTFAVRINVAQSVGEAAELSDELGNTLLQDLLVKGDYAEEQAKQAEAAAKTALTNWLSPVANKAAVDAIAGPKLGDTVQTNDNGFVYRYDGTKWVKTQEYGATALANVNAQLADKASNLTSLNPYSKTRYVGHRGLSKFAPEATQPAFELLAEYGLWGAEFDVQVTSDGVWVVYHDDTLDTLTTGTGAIKDYTLSQIKDLIFDAGNFVSKYPNQKILTFDEALNLCRKLNLIPNIEIKSTYTNTQLDSLISTIRKSGMEDKCFILGDKSACDDVRSRSRKISIMMFATSAELTHLSTLGNSVLNTNHTNITSKDFVDYMHNLGVLVSAFTVNDPALANKLESWGVDFITTDLLLGGIK